MEPHIAPLEEIIKSTGEVLEGNCVYTNQTLELDLRFASKRRNLAKAVKHATRVCEIGFNAGHSALTMLEAVEFPKTTSFVFFDLGEHAYARPCYKYMVSQFPEMKLNMVWGDSRITVPRWIQHNRWAIGAFDVVHVDGGHSLNCITSDLFAAYLLTRPGGLIIVDDIHGEHILPAVNTWMSQGILQIDPTFEATEVHPHAVLRKVC